MEYLPGDLIDYRSPEKSNYRLLVDLNQLSFEELLRELGEYTGRFVIIYIQGDEIYRDPEPLLLNALHLFLE